MRGTTAWAAVMAPTRRISIHVPRAGDDTFIPHTADSVPISIHVPRAGDDGGADLDADDAGKFQSTSPVRGTTYADWEAAGSFEISIHVPRAGDDPHVFRSLYQQDPFQSTSPVRGTTGHGAPHPRPARISIHVPRAGDDGRGGHGFGLAHHFNPRPPCGGRPLRNAAEALLSIFQSTSPVRGTTRKASRS